MKPEELLHLLAPYLPTDRFRALLRNSDLPSEAQGAVLMADISGFTPLTTRLVSEYGPQRASEELKRRINPMFEAIAGQVFIHGGSVIRFLGDGFTAWFDEQPIGIEIEARPVPAVLRALAAGLGMRSFMPLFRGLRLKVCVGVGEANRWVVGQPAHGLADVLSGPAVWRTVSLTAEAQPDQVMVHAAALPLLRDSDVALMLTESGHAVVNDISGPLADAARRYRWPAWAAESNVHQILDAIRPFVDAAVRERVESGFGDYVGELRNALPMFIQFQPGQAADPRRALDNYVCMVQSVLADFGGRLMSVEVSDKGNVLFAVFGAPVAYGDDAERALRVALTMRELTDETDIVQSVGISRGLLYAGTIGGEVRHEYSTIGDETNVAARLMISAADGQILASSAVRKEAGSRVVFRDLEPIHIKGRAEAIPVAEPVAIRAGGAREMKVGRFVGRTAELNQLRRLLKAVRVGHARVARIQGEAGIGKSRLVAELANLAHAQNFRVAGGDCVSTGQHTAYLPWQELLPSLFGLKLEADLESNVQALADFMERVLPGNLPRLPLLGDVLQLPIADTPTTATLDGVTRQQAIFALVTDLILITARRQPTLLILEDVQWIDEVSEALTIDLVRRLNLDPSPLMLVLIHRPVLDSENISALLETLQQVHFHTPIIMGEMSRIDTMSMIEKHLDASIPPELARFIYDRAQGNPFFVLEMVDTLLETGYIRVMGSRVEIIGNLQNADLPQTVQGLIQARIDRLNELDKLVLKVAAVIGLEFQVRVLEGSIPVPMTRDELLGRLRVLEARDFSYLAYSEPDLTYLFKHAITQEVTYQSLLFAQRRQLHHAVATTLELLAPDAIERLAYHFARSGIDDDRARHYLILAGQKAFREYANQAALDYFTQALGLARDDEERFEINSQRIRVMLRLGDTQGAAGQLPEMLRMAEKAERSDWRAIAHLFWADYYTQTSAWADALREAQQAITSAEEIKNDSLAWNGYLLLRSAMLSLNQRAMVVRSDLDRKMQAIAERLGDQRHVIELILTWFDDLYAEGPDIAIQGAQTALTRAEELQDPVLVAECWSVLGDLYLREYDLPSALAAARSQIGLLRQIGDRRREGLTLNRIGGLLIALGQLSEGNAHLLDAYRILRQIGERSGEAMGLLHLGTVADFYHAYGEAIAYMERALAAQRALNADIDAALTLYYMGNVYIRQEAFSEAEESLNEARSILEANRRLKNVLTLAEVDASLSAIELCRGDASAALERASAMIPRLQRRQISGLHRPGLACLRTYEALRANGQYERADQVRSGFMDAMRPTLNWLAERGWYEEFIRNIWYHAALMG